MEETIDRLLSILNKVSIAELNKMYRDKEVQLEIESFTKHPDVRWSEPLKKKMIQAAKRKRIAPGRMKYLENKVEEFNLYNVADHVNRAVADWNIFLDNLEKSSIPIEEIVLIHIELSQYNLDGTVQAYGTYEQDKYENELGLFESIFQSTDYWKDLDTNRYWNMSEQLEILEIDDEVYPQIYTQIMELRVFNALRIAIQNPDIVRRLENINGHMKIEIGIHDDTFYTIRNGNFTS